MDVVYTVRNFDGVRLATVDEGKAEAFALSHTAEDLWNSDSDWISMDYWVDGDVARTRTFEIPVDDPDEDEKVVEVFE